MVSHYCVVGIRNELATQSSSLLIFLFLDCFVVQQIVTLLKSSIYKQIGYSNAKIDVDVRKCGKGLNVSKQSVKFTPNRLRRVGLSIQVKLNYDREAFWPQPRIDTQYSELYLKETGGFQRNLFLSSLLGGLVILGSGLNS